MTLKILTLTPYPLAGPSSRYRTYQYQAPLAARGIHLDIRPFLTPEAYRLRMNGSPRHPLALGRVAVACAERLWQARVARSRYDLILVHRQAGPFAHDHFNRLVLGAGLPIVFDMDDAVFAEYPIDSLLRGSVAATVGNAYLAEYVRRTSPATVVTVVPTVVDTDKYQPAPRPPGPPVVGWIGTSSTFTRYLTPYLPGIVRVCREHGAQFRVIASPDVQARAEATGARFVPWSLDTELRELQAFDIGLMPLVDDQFVRGKCAFKLIEYGAVGRPSVGSDIGANREVIRPGVTGCLAHSPQQFESQLAELLRLPDLGLSLGAAARQVIEARFSLASQIDVMERVLRAAARSSSVPEERANVRDG